MDSVSLRPKFRSFCFEPQNCYPAKAPFSANSSFFQLAHFKKLRALSITSCYTTPSNPQKGQYSNSNGENHTFLSNPIRVSFSLLQTIKQLAALRTFKWFSNWRAYSDAQKVVDEFHGCYLQNGGRGVALLSVTANAKLRISPFVATLAANPTFVSGLFAWIIAQSIKVFLNFLVERKWDLRLLFASGGMPSSHSALCAALTTSVALCHGVADSLFPVCLGFSSIVMYDAIGVRRHAGMQAEVLNMIVADLFKGHPISERKLKELLGHTPSQVFAGAVLGIVVACFCCQVSIVAIS